VSAKTRETFLETEQQISESDLTYLRLLRIYFLEFFTAQHCATILEGPPQEQAPRTNVRDLKPHSLLKGTRNQ
jgi:hypothetical protein